MSFCSVFLAFRSGLAGGRQLFLVQEMTLAGEDHCDVILVAFVDAVLILVRAAGLNDSADACFGGVDDIVWEREEGVRGHRRTLRFITGLFHCDHS